MKLAWRGYSLDFSRKTHIMGILNVTPDSFSDGGIHFDKARAIERVRRMVEEGADIIDIGGQSTRPGAAQIAIEEEIGRTVPVIQAVAGEVGVPISIDTYRAEIARRAIEAGASMVNDISGLRFDRDMASLVADKGVPVVLMHIKGTPRDMQKNPVYEALIPEIMDYLRESIRMAEDAGLPRGMVVVDPGIGFGKTFDHNLEILNRLEDFTMLERPVAVGPSRKAFLGEVLGGAPATERVFGTAAAVCAAVLKGAGIVRVHDVKEISDVVRVADAIKRQSIS
ncbi:MAG: dihydropteroate synthase [Nitrospirota bacterium]|jgi:dihydropteroate synthase